MDVKFIQFPKNDIMPKPVIGESILYELKSPWDPNHPLSKYFLQCHQCGLRANLGDHDSVDVNDGEITISPSIQCPKCPAHYFIKNGIVC